MALQPQDLYALSVKSLANAHELVEEAQLLFDHHRWPRVVFLCQIAGEELAKCFISLTALPRYAFGTFDEAVFLRRLRDHREKTGEIDFFEQVFVGSDPIEHRDKAWCNDFERFKLLSLYADFFQEHAVQPSDAITEVVAREALRLSKARIDYFDRNVRRHLDPNFLTNINEEMLKRFEKEIPEIAKYIRKPTAE